MNTKKYLIAFSIACFSNFSHANPNNVEGMPVHLGDTVEDVQKALHTTIEPEDIASTMPFSPKKSQLRLKTKGIWVFFDKGKVTTIRLEEPFPGNVGGIKLGDSGEKVLKTFGKPIKESTIGNIVSNNYTYYFDDITTTKFTVDSNNEVVSISFIK